VGAFVFTENDIRAPFSLLNAPRSYHDFLPPKMEFRPKGQHYESTEEIHSESADEMKEQTSVSEQDNPSGIDDLKQMETISKKFEANNNFNHRLNLK
jgi:hypothetical protein